MSKFTKLDGGRLRCTHLKSNFFPSPPKDLPILGVRVVGQVEVLRSKVNYFSKVSMKSFSVGVGGD